MSKFVTIVKNGKTKSVSHSIYRNYFENAGWRVVGEENTPTPSVAEEVVENEVNETENEVNENATDVEENETETDEDEVADEEWDEAIAEEEVEKPISEMNRDELVAKAESLGIEVGNRNNNQLRKAIKEKM